jgi:hypothetical protein
VLRKQETPAPRPDFVANLRERLMDAADTLLVPGEAAPLAPVIAFPDAARRRQRRVSVAAAALIVVGGSASVAAAAENSLPGDPLYPLKRGIESAQVSFNSSDSGKGQDLLRQASTRLDEVDGLLDNKADADQITSTLSSFRRSATDGADLIFVSYQRNGDPSDITRLRSLLGSQLSELDQLSGDAPAGTNSAFDKARALVADLDQQARVLCPDCGPAGALSSTRLTSAPALAGLLLPPAEATPGASVTRPGKAASDLAAKANQIAKQQNPLTPLATQTPQASGSGGSTPGLPLPSGTPTPGPVGQAVTGVTGGVGGLLGQVTDTVGTATKPLTDPLTTVLNSVLGVQPTP